ncbi:CU044_5270 family protein [Streptomyces sp. NPDC092369]|uniref:CU044_5270 family protein n=1 Tax=Streptomyces sp. NPDC092369 TaxID=3366015 RepID=UPI0038155219
MNASPSQPHPAEWTETQDLLPSVERDLPAGRHQFHKEQMMAQIHEDLRTSAGAHPAAPTATPQRRNPFLRRAILLPGMACAVAGAVVGGIALSGGNGDGKIPLATGPALTTTIGTADAKGAPALLDRISLAAADTSETAVHDDQFVYIASKVASTYPKSVDGKDSIVSEELHDRQTWVSPDGSKGWLIEAGQTSKDGITLDSNVPLSGAYDALVKLPTDPDVLLRRIYKESDAVRDHEVPRDQAAFVAIGDLLTESYPPADVAATLYKAAAKIPGVVAVNDAVDAEGRHGIAIARQDNTGERTEWIFDKKSLRLLGERVVVVEPLADSEFKAGTVIFTSAITQRAVVDGIKQTPGGTAS